MTAVRATITEVVGTDVLPAQPRKYKCALNPPFCAHETVHAKFSAAQSVVTVGSKSNLLHSDLTRPAAAAVERVALWMSNALMHAPVRVASYHEQRGGRAPRVVIELLARCSSSSRGVQHTTRVRCVVEVGRSRATRRTKAKNAQEAHEAIRPTDPGRSPASLQRVLDAAAWRLYDLIWRRTLASQMASARLRQVRQPTATPAVTTGSSLIVSVM